MPRFAVVCVVDGSLVSAALLPARIEDASWIGACNVLGSTWETP